MISTDEMRRLLREACKAAGSQRAWAKAHRMSDAYVSDCLAGRRAPGDSIARALGYRPVTMYVPYRMKHEPRHHVRSRTP